MQDEPKDMVDPVPTEFDDDMEGAPETREGLERLNKFLARAGVASRRGADDIIAAGRIRINGEVIMDLGRQVDAQNDVVMLDGEIISSSSLERIYIALHKPPGVITTVHDERGRPTVMDLVPREPRVFPIGRLDGGSEGLLLFTNDGDLANELAHPRFMHEKEYRVKVSGTPPEKTLTTWREGVWLEDGRTLPTDVRIESSTGSGTWLRFVLTEGRNRQIRRMVEAMQHRVHRLIRVRVGPVTLGDLEKSTWRRLTDLEVAALRGDQEAIEEIEAERKGRPKKQRRRSGWAKAKPKGKKPGKGARRSRSTKRGKKSFKRKR